MNKHNTTYFVLFIVASHPLLFYLYLFFYIFLLSWDPLWLGQFVIAFVVVKEFFFDRTKVIPDSWYWGRFRKNTYQNMQVDRQRTIIVKFKMSKFLPGEKNHSYWLLKTNISVCTGLQSALDTSVSLGVALLMLLVLQ